MEVKFISTTSSRLSELPIINGQLIYLSDLNGTYYDIGSARMFISSMRVVSELPQTGQENVLYGVINAAGHVDASIWDPTSSQYVMLSGYAATVNTLGLVKPDGTTIKIDANGVISCPSLPSSVITYDNTTSGLSSTVVQGAIDEVKTIASGAATLASTALAVAEEALSAAGGASTAVDYAIQLATNASTAANYAITEANGASTAAAAASTVAAAASTAAAAATTAAANASTAAAAAQATADAATTAIAAASTAIVDHETRILALEALAAVALITEDPAST